PPPPPPSSPPRRSSELNLAAFNVRDRDFIAPGCIFGTATIPDDLAEAYGAGDILPVLVHQGTDAEEKSKGQYCPFDLSSASVPRSEEHTSELQSRFDLV